MLSVVFDYIYVAFRNNVTISTFTGKTTRIPKKKIISCVNVTWIGAILSKTPGVVAVACASCR